MINDESHGITVARPPDHSTSLAGKLAALQQARLELQAEHGHPSVARCGRENRNPEIRLASVETTSAPPADNHRDQLLDILAIWCLRGGGYGDRAGTDAQSVRRGLESWFSG